LTVSGVVGAAVLVATLVAAFNLVLDARLHSDRDNLLHERATTVLRGLGTIDGRLSVIEAPDQGAVDSQTWIFDGEKALERPPHSDPRNQRDAERLARSGSGFTTVAATDTRLGAVPVRRAGRRLGAVVVGTSERPYASTVSTALAGSLILGVLVLAAVAALSLWLIGRALRPVARMTMQASHWGEHDLSRRFFVGEPHDELTSLAAVFDALLSRLAESLRREQRLTAEISHELRTPLAKILAEAELAGGRERTASQYQESVRQILGYALALQRMLETLLASARADASARVPSSDPHAAARHAIDVVQESAVAAGKSFELSSAGPANVAVDEEVLERILAPPLENAARYARERISLQIRGEDESVIFAIQDDGPGIAPDQRERIFDPGFRGAEDRDATHGGAGLGLALARRLAHAAGGSIAVQPSSEGALLVIRLPAVLRDTPSERL